MFVMPRFVVVVGGNPGQETKQATGDRGTGDKGAITLKLFHSTYLPDGLLVKVSDHDPRNPAGNS